MTSEDLRNIGQFYLDVQQTKVACEHRMQKLLEHKLIEAGAAQLVHSSSTKSSDDEPRSDFRKLKLEVLDESLAKKVTERVKESKEFGILLQHKSRLVKQESDLLKSAEELFNNSSIWKYCFKAGEIIVTENGYKPIEEIRAGDMVIGQNGDLTRVIETYERDYSGNMITITTRKSLPLTCTPEHPILVGRRKYTRDIKFGVTKSGRFVKRVTVSDLRWTLAKSVKPGDVLVIPKLKNASVATIPSTIEMEAYTSRASLLKIKQFVLTAPLARVFGRFAADGSLGKSDNGRRYQPHIIFGKHEDTTEYEDILSGLGITYRVDSPPSLVSTKNLVIGRDSMGRMLEELTGTDCYSRRIPKSVMFGSKEVAQAFLQGYHDGDGHDRLDKRTGMTGKNISSVCEGVMLQLQLLGTRCGILPSLGRSQVPIKQILCGREVNCKSSHYRLDYILDSNRKQQHAEDEDNYYVTVKKVDISNYSGKVHNFQTENNTYLVSNMLVHNCERVRGLGPVAAMTFFTIINTDKIVDREHGEVVTAGKINKYLGLVPGQRLRSGEKMGFNTQMKGRAWMISRNVIMANDSYYATLYRLQKELYTNRPDLIAQNGYTVRDKQGHYIAVLELNSPKAKPKTKTKKNKKAQEEKQKQTVFCHACNKEVAVVTIEDKKKRPGWKAWIDAMASRYVRKIILSHATEIIAVAEGLKFSRHQNYIPPKPEFPSEIDDVLEEFREQRAVQLKRYREQFAATGNTEVIRNNMQSYWENTSSNRQKSRA